MTADEAGHAGPQIPGPAAARAGTARRAWLLRAASLGVGLALVGLLEGILRLWPGLGPPPLVVTLAERDGRLLRSTNPDYGRRFFFQRYKGRLIASGRMLAQPFVEPAPALRVVWVGESTVQGYPHPRRLAAASFLQAMLADAYSGRPVEVFNLGITSVASFAVARLLGDALQLEPDVAVVYTGHNEYYGIYGVGEGRGPLANRVHCALMQVRLARGAQGLLDWARGRQVSSQSLLRVLSARGEVPLASRAREAAPAYLEANLGDMVEACRAHGVPLVVCTLASNDAGFAPAASAAPVAGEARTGEWEAHLQAAAAALEEETVSGERAAATLGRLQEAEAIFAGSAWAAWLQGRALVALGRAGEAAAQFRRARDLDLMPWRAPGAHNQAVRRAAARPGAVLADVEAAFREHAPPEGVGWELVVDHVHPSVRGQALLARTVAAAVSAAVGASLPPPAPLREDADYRALLGDLPVERVGVDEAMANLLSEPPMDRFNAAAASRLRQAAAMGWGRLTPAEQQGARSWARHRDQGPLVLDVADRLFQAGQLSAARAHYAAARLEAPFTPRADLWAAVQWAWCTRLLGLDLGEPGRELLGEALDRAGFLAQAPDLPRPFLAFVAGELEHFLGRHAEALGHLGEAYADGEVRRQFLYTLFPALAWELVHAGRLADAREHARTARQEGGGNPYFVDLVETLAKGGSLGFDASLGGGKQP
ncbi:MAG: hypothetical protein AB1505_18520 [Candidatus Latescibacterota bacterium]